MFRSDKVHTEEVPGSTLPANLYDSLKRRGDCVRVAILHSVEERLRRSLVLDDATWTRMLLARRQLEVIVFYYQGCKVRT